MEASSGINHIQCYHTLFNNPFLFAPLFPAFYKALGDKDSGILLSYLVLPLILHKQSRAFLGKARISSTLRTLSKPENLFGISHRIASQRAMTNIVMQYNFDRGDLFLLENLGLKVPDSPNFPSFCSPILIKASSNLGKLFKRYTIPQIYVAMGIKKL